MTELAGELHTAVRTFKMSILTEISNESMETLIHMDSWIKKHICHITSNMNHKFCWKVTSSRTWNLCVVMTHLQRYKTERYKFIGRTVNCHQTQACHYFQESKKSAHTNKIQESTICKHNHGCHPLQKFGLKSTVTWRLKARTVKAEKTSITWLQQPKQPAPAMQWLAKHTSLVKDTPMKQNKSCWKWRFLWSPPRNQHLVSSEEDSYSSLRFLWASSPLAEAFPILEATV
jgi:hypothetical protein